MAERMKTVTSNASCMLCGNIGGNMGILEVKEPQSEYVLKDEAAFNRKFTKLYKEWHDKTRFDSFIGDPYNKSYDKIVQLGYRAIPCIMAKLKEDPSPIFVALIRITGEDPIKEENRGIVRKMAEDWINWWEKKNSAIGCSGA